MNFKDAAVELDRINELEDFEQQGYEAAPVICAVAGIDAVQLLHTIDVHPESDPANIKRDAGAARWCREQLEFK